MLKRRFIFAGVALMLVALFFAGSAVAQGVENTIDSVVEVQQYNRAIHIMAMLLLGFGFLMAFVRGYGRSALTATFLLVSVGIPAYLIIQWIGPFGHHGTDIENLILAEFATASLLICAGAVLGRLKMPQYIVLGALFIPFFMINEWILLGGGLGLIPVGSVADTGGSIVIHAFGALFGLGVMISMTTKKEFKTAIEADATSERFSMLGSMALWVFWPSFCAALVAPADIPHTVVNVILALCGSTLATYFASATLRRKISVADIANAALAGGVAIGATCDYASFPVAILIGILAGLLSTYGFAIVQSKLQNMLKSIDTCGVTNLHGYPGLFGGVAAIFVVAGIDAGAQLTGIAITVVLAIVFGLITGKFVSAFGTMTTPYEDKETFLEGEED